MDLSRWLRRGNDETSLASLQAQYNRASDAGDLGGEQAALQRIIKLYPDTAWAWFDLGLRAKWKRDWPKAMELNARALELEGDGAQNPSAWNLGIAATALGDWRTARRAWTVFGIKLPAGGEDKPINGDFGLTPIRLNPEPRHLGETELLIEGEVHDTEVVWSQRVCPARAIIRNVPLPESGHRFGDVVLHDGEPVGERQLGDSVRSVFNELALLERSEIPTLEVEVVAAPDEVEALVEAFVERDFGAEDWTTSVQMLCRACSEGTADAAHNHAPDAESPAGTRRLGIGAPFDIADELVDAWVLGSSARDRGPLTVVA